MFYETQTIASFSTTVDPASYCFCAFYHIACFLATLACLVVDMAQYMAPPPYYKKYTSAAMANLTAPKPPPIPEGTYTTFGVEREPTGLTTLPWKQNLLIEKEPKYRQLYGDPSLFTNRTADTHRKDSINGNAGKIDVDKDSKATDGVIADTDTSIVKNEAMVNGKVPTHTERGRKRKFDHKVELKKLNKSIVLNYLQLLDVLTSDPSQYMKVFNQLVGLFHNMHALINDCRPHQARETLRAMMEAQVEQKENCVLDLETYFDAVTSALKEVLDQVQTSDISDLLSPRKRARMVISQKVAQTPNGASIALEEDGRKGRPAEIKSEAVPEGSAKNSQGVHDHKIKPTAIKGETDSKVFDALSGRKSTDTDRPAEGGIKSEGAVRKTADSASIIARLAKAVDSISEAELDDYLTPKRLSMPL
ncbi:hypothetical protein SARC_02096 [Sphaeroforma arctica JP610]|uniref:Mediator of RNA polymerase II transcription subunit 7 n=1 Tax=Sphaeroforma arctica JP610 TaxID=667725 RepID=A0A0L0G9L6_9EUKA|nr:hypothetical protein SARC_02096 [Sphaeroforma arctica JP610]KNC85722.1 hypothetical protein SARC_02096 [Sphaeroforma arctica JP610]|eukprot:XP_014159624.1 hypothetical protein SARC_02096 [Sphaeroforma arctica JP610]